jgi:hypothetical protein
VEVSSNPSTAAYSCDRPAVSMNSRTDDYSAALANDRKPARETVHDDDRESTTGDQPIAPGRRQPSRAKVKPIRFRRIQATGSPPHVTVSPGFFQEKDNHVRSNLLTKDNDNFASFEKVSDTAEKVFSNGRSYKCYTVYPQPSAADLHDSDSEAAADDITARLQNSSTVRPDFLTSAHSPVLHENSINDPFWQLYTSSGHFHANVADTDESSSQNDFFCATILHANSQNLSGFNYRATDYSCICRDMENDTSSSDDDSINDDRHRSKRSRVSLPTSIVRPFSCDQCSRTFTQFSGAVRHTVM